MQVFVGGIPATGKFPRRYDSSGINAVVADVMLVAELHGLSRVMSAASYKGERATASTATRQSLQKSVEKTLNRAMKFVLR